MPEWRSRTGTRRRHLRLRERRAGITQPSWSFRLALLVLLASFISRQIRYTLKYLLVFACCTFSVISLVMVLHFFILGNLERVSSRPRMPRADFRPAQVSQNTEKADKRKIFSLMKTPNEGIEPLCAVLDDLTELVVKSFVMPRYAAIAPLKTSSFEAHVDSALKKAAAVLLERFMLVDWNAVVLQRVIPLIYDHMIVFRQLCEQLPSARQMPLSEEMGLFISQAFAERREAHLKLHGRDEHKFHPALGSPTLQSVESEEVWLRRVAASFVPFLTGSENDLFNLVMRDLTTKVALLPLISILSTPHIWNSLIESKTAESLREQLMVTRLRTALVEQSGNPSLADLPRTGLNLFDYEVFYLPTRSFDPYLKEIDALQSLPQCHKLHNDLMALLLIEKQKAENLRESRPQRIELAKIRLEQRILTLGGNVDPKVTSQNPQTLNDFLTNKNDFARFSEFLQESNRQPLLKLWFLVECLKNQSGLKGDTFSSDGDDAVKKLRILLDAEPLLQHFETGSLRSLLVQSPCDLSAIQAEASALQRNCYQILLEKDFQDFQGTSALSRIRLATERKELSQSHSISTPAQSDNDKRPNIDSRSPPLVNKNLPVSLDTSASHVRSPSRDRPDVSGIFSPKIEEPRKSLPSITVSTRTLFDDILKDTHKQLDASETDNTNALGFAEGSIQPVLPGDLDLPLRIKKLNELNSRLADQVLMVENLMRQAQLEENEPQRNIFKSSRETLLRELRLNELQIAHYQSRSTEYRLDSKSTVIRIVDTMTSNGAEGPFTGYVIHVATGKTSGWTVVRRFREFSALFNSLHDKIPALKNVPFPSRIVLGSLSEQVVQQRKVALDSFINALIRDPDAAQSFELRSFLSSSSLSDEGASSVTLPPNNKASLDVLSSTFSSTFVSTFMKLVSINEKENWVRYQTLIVLLQQVLGGTIERRFRELLHTGLAPNTLAKSLGQLRDRFWGADGVFNRPPDISLTQRIATRESAYGNLEGLFPEVFLHLVGKSNLVQALQTLFVALQYQRLNKHLCYFILQTFLEEVFPEAAPFIAEA